MGEAKVGKRGVFCYFGAVFLSVCAKWNTHTTFAGPNCCLFNQKYAYCCNFSMLLQKPMNGSSIYIGRYVFWHIFYMRMVSSWYKTELSSAELWERFYSTSTHYAQSVKKRTFFHVLPINLYTLFLFVCLLAFLFCLLVQ